MRAWLIRDVSMDSTLVLIKSWSNDVIVVSPVGRAREYPIGRFQQIIPVYGPSVQVKIIRFRMLAGYSCTVHGTHGGCYDRVWVDMAAFFAAAHTYVALSRARSLQGLFIVATRQFLCEAGHSRCDIGRNNAACSDFKGYLYSRICPTRTTHLAALNCWSSFRVSHEHLH